jgi:hypothetical protein
MSQAASQSDKMALADAWKSSDTPATVLLAIVVDMFGIESLGWEHDTVKESIESALGINVLQREMDRYAALVLSLTTNMAFTDVMVFHHTMNALNGSQAMFSTWDPVDLDELTWGLTEIMLNDNPVDDEDWATRFAPDVRRYIGLLAGGGRYAPASIPEVVKLTADFGSTVSGEAEMTADPMLYGTAHENSVAESDLAAKYTDARMTILLDMLKVLPLRTRSGSWKESVASKGLGAVPK